MRPLVALLLTLALGAGCAASAPPPAPGRTPFFKQAGRPNVIVFVHGVTGDAVATWRNATTRALWPEMMTRDPAFADFDIYLAGYDSPLLGRSSTIEEIAQRLLGQITDDGLFDRYAQIHVVAHSMGGLITKRMLVELNRPRPRDIERLRRVRSVVFLATPAQGAPVAALGALLSWNPQFANMEPATANAFIQSVENQWQALLRDRDDTDAEFPFAFCAYEKKPMVGTAEIVNNVFAATRCDATPVAFDLNHSAIVKPADERSEPYPWTKARLLQAARHPASRARPAGREFRLAVQVHEIKSDTKGRQLEARQLTGPAAAETPEAAVADVAGWLTARLQQIYELDRPHATFRLRVPADPSREPLTIDRTSEAAVDAAVYVVQGGAKARVKPDQFVLGALARDFDLEISAPGYAGTVRRITWGRAVDETVSLAPAPLRIGIEDFPGDPALGARLAAALVRHPRIHIKDPATLVALRRELEAKMALIAANPHSQMSLRDSLGLDVLVSGRYDVR
ncbi:MAG TPA: alpha/beta fold hydrolase [Candidatus Limnocylindria bacterium]|nr:alpha/beta fold hydrolase [Candidatus Limnocylindria bacterium]